MRILALGALFGLAALVFGLSAQAEPFNPKRVPADAKWLVHVDVDAMRTSTVAQKAWHKHLERHKDAQQRLEKLRGTIGMDPSKDLHGVTLYGKQVGQHTGVMLVQAKVDHKLLLAKAEKAPDHKVTKYGDYDLHTWTHKGHGPMRTVAGTFYKDAWLVFASSLDELKAALDVLDGKAASLGTGSPLAGKVPAGTTVLIRATGLAGANLPCKSPLAKQTESVRIVMGENNGQSFFRAKAVMTNAEVVGQVKSIIDGARALATLHCQNDEQSKKLIDALKVTTEDKTLILGWSAPAGEAWEALQKHAKALAGKRAKRPAAHHGPKGCGKDTKPAEKKPAEEEF